MKCVDVQLMLPDFVVNKVTNGQVSNIQQHLAACQRCGRAAEEMQALMLDLSKVKHEMPSDAYFATILPRVHKKIEDREGTIRIPEYIYRYIMPMAMVLLVVAFSSNFNRIFPEKLLPVTTASEETLSSDDVTTIIGQEEVTPYDKVTSTDKSVLTELITAADGSLPINDDDVKTLAASLDHEDFSEFYTLLEQQSTKN